MSHQFQHEDHFRTLFGTVGSGDALVTRDDVRELWLYNPGTASVTVTQGGNVLATIQAKGSMSAPWYFASADAPVAGGPLNYALTYNG